MADVGDRHVDHDPLLIASLLDGDVDEAERVTAQSRIDECGECASLYADLVALSLATRAQPATPRPRDFRLTAGDAARLRAEPAASNARLTGVMTDTATDHRTHDVTLVASLADHSLGPTERAAAEALVAVCSECANLHTDLMTLVAATRAMPTPPRPSDYTLTPDDAARLRGPWWRRLAAAIGSSRDGVTRPLAIGLSTLGLVGILVASGPSIVQMSPGLSGSAASSQGGQAAQPIDNAAPPSVNDTTGEAGPGAALAPTSGGAAAGSTSAPDRAAVSQAPVFGVAIPPNPAATAGPLTDTSGKGTGTVATEPSSADLAPSPATTEAARASTLDPLLLVSAALLLVGFGLFVVRWSARRLSDS